MRWRFVPLVLSMAAYAHAATDTPPVVLLRTLTPAGDGTGPLHIPTSSEPAVEERALELDATLRDGVQDLGMRLPLGEAQTAQAARDVDLLERAQKEPETWIVSPRVESHEGAFLVRIVAVPPGSKEIHTRVEIVKGADVSARGLVMLRDLVKEAKQTPLPPPCPPVTVTPSVETPRSAGRAVLAINGTAFGAFVAYGLHRVTLGAGNTNQPGGEFGDPRVALPLAALGAGVGMGASLLVAEEWDISPAMAWYLTGGTWWGVATGLFLSSGYDVLPLNDRFYYAIGGGSIGLSLATFALTQRKIDDGGMLLTHSSAALGLVIGGLMEMIAKGPSDPIERPTPTGWGFGSMFGLLGGGTLALFLKVPASRVLLVDLGAVLGTLVTSAAFSPLINPDVVGNLDPDKTRAWAVATISGSVLGAAAAVYLTRNIKPAVTAWKWGSPYAGVIGESMWRNRSEPAWGIGYSGRF
jgi:hypothetical protein